MENILYSIYRLIFEKASIQTIVTELNLKDDFINFLRRLKTFSWKSALYTKNKFERLSILEAIPNFFIEHLTPVMNFDSIKRNIRYMNQFADQESTTFRVNTLTTGSNSLQSLISSMEEDLDKMDIKIWKDKDIPLIFHTLYKNKSKILRSRYYKSAKIIFQDKATSAIVDLLSPLPEDEILDICAAPGIKSSLIAQLTENKARLICNDFTQTRLEFMGKFLNFLNVSNFFLLNSDATHLPIKIANKFDKILIDPPCTGSGTFLLNPELKWRQNQNFLDQNLLIQEKLIKTALTYLKRKGVLVYSTCSLYPEEGELQIMKFIESLEPLSIPNWFSPSYKINNHILKGTGRLFPAVHKTQGFFVGRFKKKE